MEIERISIDPHGCPNSPESYKDTNFQILGLLSKDDPSRVEACLMVTEKLVRREPAELPEVNLSNSLVPLSTSNAQCS